MIYEKPYTMLEEKDKKKSEIEPQLDFVMIVDLLFIITENTIFSFFADSSFKFGICIYITMVP